MQPTSKKTVIKMRAEYEKVIRKFSTENLKKKFPEKPGIEDAASTWISRKDLNTLLDANNADGLRIYYGCYYKSTNTDPQKDYNGLHHLIFVATKSTNPANPTMETSVDQLKDLSTTSEDSDEEPTDYTDAAAGDTLLCPPHCPTETPPGGDD